MPASRVGDMHVCPMVTGIVPHVGGPVIPPGAITVLIGGMPAARIGDMCVCVGPPDVIALGAMTVIVSGMPQARILDLTAHGGMLVLGCPTVIVGDGAGGGGGGGGGGGASGGGGGGGAAAAPPAAGPAPAASAPVVASAPTPATPAAQQPQATQAELQHGKEMARYASDSYNDPDKATIPRVDRSELSPEINAILDDPKAGFSAAIYAPDADHIVVAFRGTELSDPGDLWTDVKQALGFHSDQYDQAARLAQAVQAQYPGKQIEFTGHSLGGGLAQMASAVTGLPATTFNAAGVHPNTLGAFQLDPGKIVNFSVEGDGLTAVQESSILGWQPPAAAGKQIKLPLPPADANRNLLQKAKDAIAAPFVHHMMSSVDSGLDYALQQKAGGK